MSAVLREEPLALPPHALTTLSALGLPPPVLLVGARYEQSMTIHTHTAVSLTDRNYVLRTSLIYSYSYHIPTLKYYKLKGSARPITTCHHIKHALFDH